MFVVSIKNGFWVMVKIVGIEFKVNIIFMNVMMLIIINIGVIYYCFCCL